MVGIAPSTLLANATTDELRGRLSKLITQESPPTKRARVELGSSKRDLQKQIGA